MRRKPLLRVRKTGALQVSALLDNGNVIRLTGVTRGNLPRVLAAGKQEISHPE